MHGEAGGSYHGVSRSSNGDRRAGGGHRLPRMCPPARSPSHVVVEPSEFTDRDRGQQVGDRPLRLQAAKRCRTEAFHPKHQVVRCLRRYRDRFLCDRLGDVRPLDARSLEPPECHRPNVDAGKSREASFRQPASSPRTASPWGVAPIIDRAVVPTPDGQNFDAERRPRTYSLRFTRRLVPWPNDTTTSSPFEPMSKRRRGFP